MICAPTSTSNEIRSKKTVTEALLVPASFSRGMLWPSNSTGSPCTHVIHILSRGLVTKRGHNPSILKTHGKVTPYRKADRGCLSSSSCDRCDYAPYATRRRWTTACTVAPVRSIDFWRLLTFWQKWWLLHFPRLDLSVLPPRNVMRCSSNASNARQ